MLVVYIRWTDFCFGKQEQNRSINKIITGKTFVKENMPYQKKCKEEYIFLWTIHHEV